MRRQRNWSFREALLHLLESRVKDAPSVDRLTLLRGPGAELRANRSRMKISFGFFARRFFDASLDSNLAFDFHPVQDQRSLWIFFQLQAFLTRIVGKENKTALIEFL